MGKKSEFLGFWDSRENPDFFFFNGKNAAGDLGESRNSQEKLGKIPGNPKKFRELGKLPHKKKIWILIFICIFFC